MKFKRSLFLVCSLLALFLFNVACSPNQRSLKNSESMASLDMISMDKVPPPPPGTSETNQDSYNPKPIKRGELTLVSNSIEKTRETLYLFVKACNGNVISENLVKSDFTSYYDISLNVQATDFDKFLHLIDSAKLNILSRSFTVQDITLQYIDDSTRLQNKKKLENKYLDLLSKAKDIRSTLDIEAKLEEIRTDIEVKEGQLKLLDKQVAYSDFSVRIELDDKNLANSSRHNFIYRIGKGISNGWYGMKEFVIFLVTIWPVYIFAAGLIYLVQYILKKRRKNKK
jgi:hypothetical protein